MVKNMEKWRMEAEVSLTGADVQTEPKVILSK
jgi:hypothetical protein